MGKKYLMSFLKMGKHCSFSMPPQSTARYLSAQSQKPLNSKRKAKNPARVGGNMQIFKSTKQFAFLKMCHVFVWFVHLARNSRLVLLSFGTGAQFQQLHQI